MATLAVVFAQLYTSDGVCHGLHQFAVPIRDPRTLQPYPGVFVGDMGEKLGQNGLANGYDIMELSSGVSCHILDYLPSYMRKFMQSSLLTYMHIFSRLIICMETCLIVEQKV